VDTERRAAALGIVGEQLCEAAQLLLVQRGTTAARSRSLSQRDQWLSLLDDVGGEFGRIAFTDVPHRMDRGGRDR
jgi:hypothetical protein